MFLTVHSSIGVAATTVAGITNPAAAFALGWFLHYVGDAIPHGDEKIGEWVMVGPKPVWRAVPFFAGDFAVMSSIFAVYSFHAGFSWSLVAVIAGSILPDVLFGVEMVFKRSLFGPVAHFHKWAHHLLGIRLPFKAGLPIQLAVLALMWWIIL
jgi:hypothetical protein